MYVNTLIVGILAVFAGVSNVHGNPSDYLSLWNQPEKIEKRNDIKAAIIGGEEVNDDGQFPYQVALQTSWDYKQFCGGSVLNSRWILTAAHCIVSGKYRLSESQIVVFAGSANLTKNGYRLKVSKIVIHSKYYKNVDGRKSDIALLKLRTSLPMNNRLIKAVTLPQKSYPAGTACIVSGWGRSQYTEHPTQLRALKTYTTNFENCLKVHSSKRVDSTNLCAKNVNGTGACHGDSGGPLVVFENKIPVQIGVVSGTAPEACLHVPLDIYVDVTKFIDFIKDTIKNM